jgi:hypothetical protein
MNNITRKKGSEMKIVSARITPNFIAIPEVFVTLEDGNEVLLFDYYPDEISFIASEFIGLTVEEGRRLKFDKDVAYLRA